MKVETLQAAVEGAPTLIVPDGIGGTTYYLITDEVIQRAVGRMAERNGWNESERKGLYEVVAALVFEEWPWDTEDN